MTHLTLTELLFLALYTFAWLFLSSCITTSIMDDLDRKRMRNKPQAQPCTGPLITNNTFTHHDSSGIYFTNATASDIYGNTTTLNTNNNEAQTTTYTNT